MPKQTPVQKQFLDVIDRDEAERRFHSAISLQPIGVESVTLDQALDRVLASDIVAKVDVPSFDRSNFDGFAVRAADTFGAAEETPKRLRLLKESIATAVVPQVGITDRTAISIATGGMIPRGADAVLMVEHSDCDEDELIVRKSVTSGFGIAFTASDISRGETVLRRGELLTSRETGTLAAIGATHVSVWKRPRVAIISTGDEIISPGESMRPSMVYDSNGQILSDAVREAGGESLFLGIVRDDLKQLKTYVRQGIDSADVVVMTGGTSKGEGDLCYQAVRELAHPGIVAHGVALKPGKPVCLAATDGKPVVVLPGFPTSAVFTFHEFVAPVIRMLGGRSRERSRQMQARLAAKVNSEIGRTEYLLVGLVPSGPSNLADHSNSAESLVAFPMGKGSGSVTTFSRADGFVTIDRHTEIVDQGTIVSVTALGSKLAVADLVVIGSHCTTLDMLMGRLQEQGFHTKFLAVGSTAGLHAAKRNECDIAGIHLLDELTETYNQTFADDSIELIRGYPRLQGFVCRADDGRFQGIEEAETAIEIAIKDNACMMVNRNQGSGTRVLIEKYLKGSQPSGYAIQAKNHNAVVASIEQQRADWGIAIESVAKRESIRFLPLVNEEFDFAIPKSRLNRPAVVAFRTMLSERDAYRG